MFETLKTSAHGPGRRVLKTEMGLAGQGAMVINPAFSGSVQVGTSENFPGGRYLKHR